MRPALALSIALAALTACTQFPELDATLPAGQANAPYPDLVPLASLVERADASGSRAASTEAEVSSRLAGLRARAVGLRGPVIPPAIRTRMLRGIR